MKKILLLLSCFLATWCSSVQAQTVAYINSASYDADNSQINAYFTSRNAYKIELGFISQHGGSMSSPLYKKSFGVIDGATSWATIDVDPNFEEGLYQVLLYVNGSSSVSGNQPVNVTAKGIINSVNVSGSNATANYKLWHGIRSNSTMKVFKKNTNTLLKTINLSNPNTAKNSTKNVSLGTYGDGEYTCVLYTNGRELHRKDFRIEIKIPIIEIEGEIKLATYTPQFNTLTVEYILKNAASANLTICDGSGREIKNCGTITNSSSTRKITIENVQYVSEGYYAKISATPSKGQSKTFTKFISMAGGDGNGPAYANDEIRNMWYDSSTGKINVDFNLKTSGVKVQLQVVDTRSGGWITGRTWYCPQNCGSDFISVPSYNGTVMYVVMLFVNGSPAASKQIMVSR